MADTTSRDGLRRNSLSLTELTMSGLAWVAPAFSIIFTTGAIAAISGANVPLVFLFGMIAIGATANSLAQFSRVWPSSGSFLSFISRSVSSRVGVNVGVLALLGYLIIWSGTYTFTAHYIVGVLLGQPNIPGLSQIVIVLYTALLMVPVLLDVRIGLRVAMLLYCFEVVVLLVFAIAILTQGGSNGLSLSPFTLGPKGLLGVGLAFPLAVFAFLGFEAPATLAEEAKKPRRNIPLALGISIVLSGVVYLLVSYAAVVAFGSNGDKLAASADPFVMAAARFIPPFTGLVAWILLSSHTSAGLADFTANTRVIYRGARDRVLPSVLGVVHPRLRTPWVGIAAFGGVPMAIALVSNSVVTDPSAISGFLITLGTLCVMVMYAGVNVALIVQYVRDRRAGIVRSVLGWVVAPTIGALVLIFPFWSQIEPGQAPPSNYLWLILIGIVLVSLAYTTYRFAVTPALNKWSGGEGVEELDVDEIPRTQGGVA